MCQLVHLSCAGNPNSPQSSPCIKGRGCSGWDKRGGTPGMSQTPVPGVPAHGTPREGGWASSGLHSLGGLPRSWVPRHVPVPGSEEAPGYFKAMFSPPPHRPPRRCPRQAWSEAGDGVMRLRQSPPAAPRQPRGRAKVSPAAGYSRAPCRNPPAVTRGQLPLTPSPGAPSSPMSSPTSIQPDTMLLTQPGGETP